MDGMREREQHEPLDERHEHDEPAVEAKLHQGPMDLADVRAKLQSKTGKQYWRTLEELAGDPEFEELLHREFPRQAPSEWDDSVDRRDFLKLMAASLAFAGLSGCGRTPEQYVVPYVKQPDGMTLGDAVRRGCHWSAGGEPRRAPDENRG
jgi:MoCo/4Fe-4S cofactor protein with predicted Tat translocation signal